MESYRDTSIPATSRAVNLVRQHHGVPSPFEGMVPPAETKATSLRRIWRNEARANHLRAYRRSVQLHEIPTAQLPAILEVSGGSNFVVLTEKVDEDNLRIQFADARVAVVDRERLLEVYDGNCVFLNPRFSRDSGKGGKWSRWKGFFRSVTTGKGFVKSFVFNLAVLFGALLLVQFHGGEFEGYGTRSILFPLLAVFSSGLAAAGLVQLRRDLINRKQETNWMDMAFVPIFLSTTLAIGGAICLPSLAICGAVFVYFLISRRLGTMPSRLIGSRLSIVGLSFLFGSAMASASVLQGHLHPSVMVGMTVVGTYATYLMTKSDLLWQRARLEAWA